MKKLLIIFSIFRTFLCFSQEYSDLRIERKILDLSKKVVDSSYVDSKTGIMLKSPVLNYEVYDNLTSHVVSKDPDYSDNKVYSDFKDIYKTGVESDFIKMTKSNNSAIRVYGVWSLIRNKKFKTARKMIEIEAQNPSYVFWNSLGCEIDSIQTDKLMADLLKRYKKYGS